MASITNFISGRWAFPGEPGILHRAREPVDSPFWMDVREIATWSVSSEGAYDAWGFPFAHIELCLFRVGRQKF